MEKKLGLFPMVASILAGMIGSGVYDIAYQLGSVASPGGAIVAWATCFVGMLMFIMSLQNLLDKEPDGDGMYIYARRLAGPLGEFMSGWGYWLSGWIGNIAFATMMMIALGTFFPVLGDTGTSWPSIAIASVVMWGIFLLINRGVENAMVVNAALTVLKVVPLLLFFVVTVTSFSLGVFTKDFWTNFAGNAAAAGTGFDLGSVFSQATNSMLSIIWLFMGVEAAALMSGRAKSKAIASRASILGLVTGTVVLFIISMLPYGIMPADEFVALGEPSVGQMLVQFIGPIGASLVQAATILSIFGCWISYTLMPTESTQILSEHGLLPARWAKRNKQGVATYSLFLTTLLCQVMLFSMHFTEDAYNFGFSLSSSAILVTWVMVTAYNLVRSIRHREEPGSLKSIVVGAVGTAYMLYAMFISGFVYILLLCAPFAVGFVFYYQARKQAGVEKVFNGAEKVAVAVVIAIAAVGIFAYATGLV